MKETKQKIGYVIDRFDNELWNMGEKEHWAYRQKARIIGLGFGGIGLNFLIGGSILFSKLGVPEGRRAFVAAYLTAAAYALADGVYTFIKGERPLHLTSNLLEKIGIPVNAVNPTATELYATNTDGTRKLVSGTVRIGDTCLAERMGPNPFVQESCRVISVDKKGFDFQSQYGAIGRHTYGSSGAILLRNENNQQIVYS
ncbi:MAG: hypothetical protein AABX07_00050 [Nanoarchaeota archaeon]